MMTMQEEVEKFDTYYKDLKSRRMRAKKHPEEFTEEQLDDLRVEWVFSKHEYRLNEWNRDVVGLEEDMLNSFLKNDEVVSVNEMARRLDIGPSWMYDDEQGMMVAAIRELEEVGKIEVIREPCTAIPAKVIYNDKPFSKMVITEPIDGHGISKLTCGNCQLRLAQTQTYAENGELVAS